MSPAKTAIRFATAGLLAAAAVSAGPIFSLKTNSDFPTLGTDFAFRAGRLQPFIGVSNYSFRVKETRSVTPDPGGTQSSENSTAATVFITSLGLRLNLRDGGVKPYLYGNVYKLFTILDADGNTREEDEEIEQIYSPWGFGAGLGGEYAVSEKFAVFGEYGIRALFPTSKRSTSDTFSGSVTKTELSMMFSALSGAAGIRFYF
jgi:hypothetical protein